jgi:hypothetical protein
VLLHRLLLAPTVFSLLLIAATLQWIFDSAVQDRSPVGHMHVQSTITSHTRNAVVGGGKIKACAFPTWKSITFLVHHLSVCEEKCTFSSHVNLLFILLDGVSLYSKLAFN